MFKRDRCVAASLSLPWLSHPTQGSPTCTQTCLAPSSSKHLSSPSHTPWLWPLSCLEFPCSSPSLECPSSWSCHPTSSTVTFARTAQAPLCLGSLAAVQFCSLGTRWPLPGPGHKLSHPTEGMYPAKIISRPFTGAWHMEVTHTVGFGVTGSTPSVPSPHKSTAPWSRAPPPENPRSGPPQPQPSHYRCLGVCCLPHWAEVLWHRSCLFIVNSTVTKTAIT